LATAFDAAGYSRICSRIARDST